MDFIDISIYITYLLLAVAAIAAIVFPIIFMAQNLKKAKNTFMGIGVILLLFAISLIFSTNESYEKYAVDASLSLQVGAALILLYFMLVLSFALAIISEVSQIFKK